MLSTRAKGLKPSPTLALATKAKELKAEGKDVISLSVGEPDWDTFSTIKKAGLRSIEAGQTKYAPAGGLPELRAAIAKQNSNDLGVEFSADNVSVTAGGKFSIFSAVHMLVEPGDEVIIPAPYWVSYPTIVELAGGMPRVVVGDKSTNFRLTPELLRENLNEKTKLLILNSPSNPTGLMYSKEELKGLADVLRDYPNVVIMSDDIYNRLVFTEEGLAPHILHVAPELQDRTVIINGASKTYSMTGWRIGWAVAPVKLVGAMNKYQSQSVSCAAPFTQIATVAAIEESEAELKEALQLLKKRRDFVVEKVSALPGIQLVPPDGAFYIWPEISSYFGKSINGSKISNSKEFCAALLEDQMVAAVPGAEFGLEGYMRISYALNEERMSQAIDRIGQFLQKFQ